RRAPPPPHVPRLRPEYVGYPPARCRLALHPRRHDVPPDAHRSELFALPARGRPLARRVVLPDRLDEGRPPQRLARRRLSHPNETGDALAYRPCGLAVAAAREVPAIGTEHEQARVALGDDLEERVDRMGAAHAQTFDAN